MNNCRHLSMVMLCCALTDSLTAGRWPGVLTVVLWRGVALVLSVVGRGVALVLFVVCGRRGCMLLIVCGRRGLLILGVQAVGSGALLFTPDI